MVHTGCYPNIKNPAKFQILVVPVL
jgi:hypothetical protein